MCVSEEDGDEPDFLGSGPGRNHSTMMYTDCTTEGISTLNACDRNIMDNISALFCSLCKGMSGIIPLSETVSAGTIFVEYCFALSGETKVQRTEEKYIFSFLFFFSDNNSL